MPPNFAIATERYKDGFTVVEVDTKEATYQGVAWQTMGDYGKRKWENMLVLSRPQERLKIIYA